MSWTHNAPGLFKEQRRRSRSTWSAPASACGGGGRLLSCDLILDNQTGNKAEQNNPNPTKHHVSLEN
jgi:hypothetical protein